MADRVTKLTLKGEDDGASSLFDNVSEKASGLGSALGGFALGGATVAAGAFAAVGVAATNFANDIDSGMGRFSARTGITGDALEEFEGIARNVFLNNWGESFGDVADSMATVRSITQLTGQDLEDLTTQGLILRDVFGAEVQESVRAADTAMENFGITGQNAMDLITVGFQRTGDPAGDLLDTVNEYSADFAEAGFSAEDMFATLVAGADAGVFNLDKVADSVREFTTRLTDGSTLTHDSLTSIGIDADELFQGMSDGSITAQDAMYQVIGALEGIEDPLLRDQVGVGLFGSMWEDLGANAILALDDIEGGLGDVDGATAAAGTAISDNLSGKWETFKRETLTTLEPVGVAILDFANGMGPELQEFADWFAVWFPQAISDFSDFVTNEFIPTWSGNIDNIKVIWELGSQNIIDLVDNFKLTWDAIGTWFDESVVQPWQGNIDNIETIWTTGKANIEGVIDGFKLTWGAIGTWFDESVVQPWQGNIDSIETIWSTGKANIEGVVDGFKLTWGALGGWFNDNVVAPLGGFITDIENAFTDPDWAGIGQGIVDGVAGAISSGAQAIIDAAAAAAQSALNAAMSALGIPTGGGGSGSMGNIPGNAAGTNFWEGGLTIVGEEGPELVNLPRGSRIFNANETSQMLSGARTPTGSGGQQPVIHIGQIIINDRSAAELLLAFLEGNVTERALTSF